MGKAYYRVVLVLLVIMLLMSCTTYSCDSCQGKGEEGTEGEEDAPKVDTQEEAEPQRHITYIGSDPRQESSVVNEETVN